MLSHCMQRKGPVFSPKIILPAVDRRQFLKGGSALVAATALPASGRTLPSAAFSTPIVDVFVDLHRARKWDGSNGDTWDPFWADDGSLYAFNCDGRGFGPKSMNLAFNRLEGDSIDRLQGSQVNAMAEYG